MKRKLLYFLSLISLFISFFIPLAITNVAHAETVTCEDAVGRASVNYIYSNAAPSTSDTKITVQIDSNNGLPTSSPSNPYALRFVLFDKDGNGKMDYAPGGGAFQSNVGPIDFAANRNSAKFDLYDSTRDAALATGDYFEIYLIHYEHFDAPTAERLCKGLLTVSGPPGPPGGGDCTIQFKGSKASYTPTEGVSFKVSGLDNADNPNIRRGISLLQCDLNSEGLCNGIFHEISNMCVDQPRLTNLDPNAWVDIKSEYGNTLPTGDYTLRIMDSCSVFGSPQEPEKCEASIRVCQSGDCLLPGGECDPNNNQCPTNTPFCMHKDINDSNSKYVCRTLPPVQEQCRDGFCRTAIGNFGYEPAEFAKSVLALILSLAGGIVLLFLIINGYKLMTSSGDPEKVKEAKESIISAIAGLLFIIFSLVILQFLTVDILQLPRFKP